MILQALLMMWLCKCFLRSILVCRKAKVDRQPASSATGHKCISCALTSLQKNHVSKCMERTLLFHFTKITNFQKESRITYILPFLPLATMYTTFSWKFFSTDFLEIGSACVLILTTSFPPTKDSHKPIAPPTKKHLNVDLVWCLWLKIYFRGRPFYIVSPSSKSV